MKNWKILLGLIIGLGLVDYTLKIYTTNTQDFKSMTPPKTNHRKPILLLGTTDFHGFIDPEFVEIQNTKVEKAGAKLFAVVKKSYIEAAGLYPVVHLDAGDLFQALWFRICSRDSLLSIF